jgi:hypothetical protein
MKQERKSPTAAALTLAEADKVKGTGTSTPKSRAMRLVALYKRERGGRPSR